MTATPQTPRPEVGPPVPLTVAALLVGVEAIVFLVLAVVEVAAFESSKAVMGATTTLFFVVYGLGLAVCAYAVWRLHSWARAPVALAQALQLALAWSFWGEPTTWVAATLAVVAVAVLVGLLHPRSTAALADDV